MSAAGKTNKTDDHYTILFVEDESDVLEILQCFIENERPNWRPLFASNAKDALDLLAIESIDLIATDLEMPIKNGIELLEEVKDLYPHLPRISMSGSARPQLLSRAISLTQARISKPYTFNEVSATIERCLKRWDRNESCHYPQPYQKPCQATSNGRSPLAI